MPVTAATRSDVEQRPAEPYIAPPAAPVAAREERSLESRVGSQWFNRIGIVAVLIGVAWFLKFAFDNQWIGPAGRILIGLLSGAALIAWSERFRAKGFAAFSYSLKAVGSGVLYLSLWAAFSMYHLVPSSVAFAGMVLVTAFNAFIAWRQSAELLAVYAIVGAFSTPLLLSTGRNEEVFLFSYLLMMNAATMALLVLKGWNRLLVLSFLGTVGFYWGWYWQFYAPAAFVTTTVFLSLFILLFAAATILARQKHAHAEQGDVARVLISMANAAFGFLGFYAMLSHDGTARNTALAWCSVGFGAFYLGVRKWMERTPIAGTRLASLSDIQLSIAIVFLTLAVPLAVHGHWVTVGWMTEGAVLVWVATRMRHPADAGACQWRPGAGADLAGDGCHHRTDAGDLEHALSQLRRLDRVARDLRAAGATRDRTRDIDHLGDAGGGLRGDSATTSGDHRAAGDSHFLVERSPAGALWV